MMAAIYPRQSVEKKDSLSIEQQIDQCIHLCDTNGWEYKIYNKDRGFSGKNMNRPAFEEMMADVCAGRIDVIVCYKLDRISRNIRDFSNLIYDLEKYHCQLVSVSEKFDTDSPAGRTMVYIAMIFAQMERETDSQRSHDNYYYRTELGFWGGGYAPYGYRLARIKYKGQMHTVLEPDPETAPIVRQMYEWYLQPGWGANRILTRLNQELHIPSKKGKQWTSRVLMEILSRPVYAPNDMAMYNYLTGEGAVISNSPAEFDGKASVDLYGKKNPAASKHKRCRDISDMYCNVSSHDAIIDSDTWIKVQLKRKEMLSLPSRSGTGKNSYFTGLMKCGCCGRGVSWTNSRNTQGYYICSSKKNLGYTSCPAPNFAKKKTDPAIISAVISHYADSAIRAKIDQAYIEPRKEDRLTAAKKNEYQSQIAEIDIQINNLLESIAAGNGTLIKYANEKISDLDKQKQALSQKIAALQVDDIGQDTEAQLISRLHDLLDDIPDIFDSGDFDKIKELCYILIKTIVFLEDGSIEIEYTI